MPSPEASRTPSSSVESSKSAGKGRKTIWPHFSTPRSTSFGAGKLAGPPWKVWNVSRSRGLFGGSFQSEWLEIHGNAKMLKVRIKSRTNPYSSFHVKQQWFSLDESIDLDRGYDSMTLFCGFPSDFGQGWEVGTTAEWEKFLWICHNIVSASAAYIDILIILLIALTEW